MARLYLCQRRGPGVTYKVTYKSRLYYSFSCVHFEMNSLQLFMHARKQ